jgi:hypothetical protein
VRRLRQPREVGCCCIRHFCVRGIGREPDQAAFEEPRMRLGEIVIVADDHGGAVEEIHGVVGIMAPKTRADTVGLADVGDRAAEAIRIRAGQDVDTGFGSLPAVDQIRETVPGRAEDLAGPVHDFGNHQAGGVAIGEEQADRAG